MAPASRTTANHPSTSRTTSSGILSGVFSFVSREFESFVANATGSSQTNGLDTFAELSDDEQDIEQTHENLEVGDDEIDPPIHGRNKQCAPASRPDRDIQHATAPLVKKKRFPESPSKTDADKSTPDDPSPPRSALLGVLKRRQSCTMPGSLFTRSPSMGPEANQVDLRVRFLADCEASPSSGPTQDNDPGEDNIPGPSTQLRSQYPLHTGRTGKSHDKEKIRMLEEEIQRLKTELSRRSTSTPDLILPPPPPPPPPPLPNKTILRLPTLSGDPDSLFASARAALKHAPTPSEAPINPHPSWRKGQPCIGIAPDKVAAFLTEMKTVRLRKVSGRSASAEDLLIGSSSDARMSHKKSFTTPSLRPTNLAGASTALNKYSDILSASLPAGMDAHVGEKRKRFDSIASRDDSRPTTKRRSLPSSSSSSSFASASTLSSFRLSSSASLSTSQPPSSRAAATSHNWRPPSAVDAPTPSLCSDNDNEREGDMSPEDLLPSTPPIPPSRGIFRFKGTGVPVEDESEREVIDVDMLEVYSPPTKPTSLLEDGPAVLAQRHSTTFFDRRPPSSPMPAKSPTKPRPPARVPRIVPPPRPSDDSEDEDPLSMSIASQAGGSQPSDKASQSSLKQNSRQPQEEACRRSKQPSVRSSPGESSRSKVSKAELKARRRQTLDEELRTASSEQEGGTDISLNDGILMGFGTMSKQRGFLAHGGAGGTPVFMGLGYVEGAEDPTDEAAVDDDNYPLTRFKTDSRKMGLRRS
ncbi:hypothetical protein K443DRAFT_435103 [Laccaria amethystina LaAM-08-1]|uniref:Uncharacterized protein n=1 Tax=Laccaria amethystina LaAM-08-1 TaxID=1095629 RepID=A0A0C9X4G3_9AGAR|nr:hypothetical protein K443DRAFT_435103 [Laccaria amethystina LaAM-08-1]